MFNSILCGLWMCGTYKINFNTRNSNNKIELLRYKMAKIKLKKNDHASCD